MITLASIVSRMKVDFNDMICICVRGLCMKIHERDESHTLIRWLPNKQILSNGTHKNGAFSACIRYVINNDLPKYSSCNWLFSQQPSLSFFFHLTQEQNHTAQFLLDSSLAANMHSIKGAHSRSMLWISESHRWLFQGHTSLKSVARIPSIRIFED